MNQNLDRTSWQWSHVILGTYGSWLPGDPRGFRTRNHLHHVEGDYKKPPPPGQYEAWHEQSKRLMKHAVAIIPPKLRPPVGRAFVEKLCGEGALVLAISVSGQHLHLLLKTPWGAARPWCGLAKKHAWHELANLGYPEKLWAKRGKFLTLSATGGISSMSSTTS